VFPSVPTTRPLPRQPRRAVAPGGSTAVPGQPTARRCPRRPAAILWSARPHTGRLVACPGRQPSTMEANSTTTGWRPEIRPGTRSPACRAPPSHRRRPRRRPKCRPRRR